MQAVHSFRALNCLKAAERWSDVWQVGQILKVIILFRYESAYEIDACKGLIVANPNERDEPILVFGGVAGSKDIFLVQLLKVVSYHRAELAHFLENGRHSS